MLGRKNRMAICSLLVMVVFVAMSSLAWASGTAAEDAGSGILGRLQELKQKAENAIGDFKADIEGIVDGGTTGTVLGSVKEDFAGIKDTIVDNIVGNTVLDNFAGAVTGGNVLAGASAADVSVVGSIPESVQSASLLTTFAPVLDSLDPFLKGLVGVAGPLLQPLLEPVMGLLMGGMELLAPVLGPILSTVMGIATPLLGPVMGLLMGGMELLAPIVKLSQPLLDMLGSALGSVMGLFAPSSGASAAPEPVSEPTQAKSAPAPAPTSTEVVQAPSGGIPVSSRPFAALPFTGANLLAMALLILVIAGCAVGLWKLERVLAKS